jgi:hypothetical protein
MVGLAAYRGQTTASENVGQSRFSSDDKKDKSHEFSGALRPRIHPRTDGDDELVWGGSGWRAASALWLDWILAIANSKL